MNQAQKYFHPQTVIVAITGNFGTTWTIEIEDNNGDPVDVATFGGDIVYTTASGS